jgi:hypothetical protein
VLSADLTLDGQLLGTPAYLSPEQIEGERVTERTDLYAVGLMLFEALSGRRPHGGNLRELLVARTSAPAPSLRDLAQDAPAAVASLVDALLRVRPAERPGSALEVVRLLADGVERRPLPLDDACLRSLLEARDARPDQPIPRETLRALFAAPDRLLHLGEDAAHALWRRTGGLPGRVVDELSAWVEAGLCRSGPDGLHIEREAIDCLDVVPSLVVAVTGPRGRPEIPCPLPELADTVPAESAERLRRLVIMHRDGDEVGQALAIATESCALALEHARGGKLGHAVVALAEGVRAVREQAPSALDALASLLEQWAAVAITEDFPQAIDRALYEICRTTPRAGELDAVEHLLRAALAIGEWSDRALDMLETLSPFGDARLERLRHRLRVSASRRCAPDRAERTLEEVTTWARSSPDPEARAELAWWSGRLRYREGRFEEAARLCAEAAERLTWTTERVAARIHAATAAMEAFQYEVAAAWALEAREVACACRNALLEGRAAWIERSLAYRLGRAAAPDLELVEAASRIGSLELLEAPVRRNEAAVAWRLGEHAVARELAVAARDIGRRLGESMGARLLAAGLAVACGDPATEAELEALSRSAIECDTPGVGLQVLALMAGPGAARCDPATALRLAAQVPATRWDERLDVMSIREALALCGVFP